MAKSLSANCRCAKTPEFKSIGFYIQHNFPKKKLKKDRVPTGEFFFETKNNNFWKDCSSKHKIWRPKKWGYIVSIIQANPIILLILSQFLSFPSVSACALKQRTNWIFIFQRKLKPFFSRFIGVHNSRSTGIEQRRTK